jgi:hypothetical protein
VAALIFTACCCGNRQPSASQLFVTYSAAYLANNGQWVVPLKISRVVQLCVPGEYC